MKNISILFIAALAIGLSFLACDPKAEKIKAYKSLISTAVFEDTVITYSLHSDSLVLEFAKPPRIKHWYGEVLLIKSDSYEELVVPFPEKTKENMGKVILKDQRLVLSGFHIPSDSLERYLICFHAVPRIPGFQIRGDIYGPMYLFQSELHGGNRLKVNRDVRNFKITSFDLVKLKNMSPEWRAFCRDSIEKAFHTTFTDAEIEESSYNDF